ncbi:uncharacterized protein METZ01_LOCUS291573 [marine metagenome]|uniref:Uncharacterized protein n=1 Tax=marine metagenome TaxID=408172 RepID=A0A382LPS6_9ZZZZ
MPESPKNALTRAQVIAMIICTVMTLAYITIVTWIL